MHSERLQSLIIQVERMKTLAAEAHTTIQRKTLLSLFDVVLNGLRNEMSNHPLDDVGGY